jgi:hypothetical protein
MEKTKAHRAALIYLNQYKFSVIPLKPQKGKGAYIKWAEFQKRLPTEKEIDYWFTLWDDAMVGAVTGEISNLAVVDFDLYKMTPDQKEQALALIPENLHVPIVTTPRGGQHYIFSYRDSQSDLRVCQDIFPAVDFQGAGGVTPLPPSGNGAGNYVWQEGCSIKDTAIPSLPPAIIEAVKKCSFKPAADRKPIDPDGLMTSEGSRDQDFFHVANCMVRGGLEPEYCHRVLQIVAEKANQGAKEAYTEAQVKDKIKSALQRAERRERNTSGELKDWIDLQGPGFWSLSQSFRDLSMAHKEDKQICYVTVRQMVNDSILERGDRSGIFRKVEKIKDFVNIADTPDLTFLDLKWPLKCEDLIKISPKSITIIAGETESGKSAFCSSFTNLNMDKHEIFYFSSEMTASRFKNRVDKSGRNIKEWSKVKFTDEIRTNFQDIIQPDGINIIDYLELDSEKLYNSANIIRSIFEKLNTGIAIIAMQKKEGMKWAYGQYLTLSRTDAGNIASIEKGKNWRSDMVNPVGFKRKFLLVKGIEFLPEKNYPNWVRKFVAPQSEY